MRGPFIKDVINQGGGVCSYLISYLVKEMTKEVKNLKIFMNGP